MFHPFFPIFISFILPDLHLLKGFSTITISVACFVAFPPSVPEMVGFASYKSMKEFLPFYNTFDQNCS